MFTGIIETLGKLTKIEKEGSNIHFTFESPITNELKVDQSVAHNGVCLTVVQLLGDNQYTVTAIDETLQRTNLGELIVGGEVNLERCMPANGRFDGHIVQGHVDQLGEVRSVEEKGGRFGFRSRYLPAYNDNVHLRTKSIMPSPRKEHDMTAGDYCMHTLSILVHASASL